MTSMNGLLAGACLWAALAQTSVTPMTPSEPHEALAFFEGSRWLPDGWEFSTDVGTGDSRVRTRVTIARIAAGRFRLVVETSQGARPWMIEATEHYRRLDTQP